MYANAVKHRLLLVSVQNASKYCCITVVGVCEPQCNHDAAQGCSVTGLGQDLPWRGGTHSACKKTLLYRYIKPSLLVLMSSVAMALTHCIHGDLTE